MSITITKIPMIHYIAYALVIGAIALVTRYALGYVHPLSEILMFFVPILAGMGLSVMRWELRRALWGLGVSAIIIGAYVLVFCVFVRPGVDVGAILGSYAPAGLVGIAVQMFVIALTEEVFFRGYLLQRIGMTITGVVIVSALFALGHFVVAFFGASWGAGASIVTLLTFFPSLVMGYMYLRSRNLWPPIIFHFLANMVYVSTGGF